MAGRPPLPIGTWGHVSTRRTGKTWTAEARFRDTDGITRRVGRTGPSAGAARASLTTALRDRAARASDGELTRESTIADLSREYLLEIKAHRSAATHDAYERASRVHIIPALGALRIREGTVPRLERFLRTVEESTGTPTARRCRIILQGMWALAVRHGAADTNPARDTSTITVAVKDPRALTVDELAALRAAAAGDWDVADFIDVALGTAGRISDVLALTWSDVDFKAMTVTLTEQKKGGRRLLRHVPAFTIAALKARKKRIQHGTTGDLVFPSSRGTVMDPSNFRRSWRAATKEAKVEWATPHVLRKTAATVLADALGDAVAADHLGHAPGSSVTSKHYLERGTEGPDVGGVLDRALKARKK